MTDRERIEQLELQVHHLAQIVQRLTTAREPVRAQWVKSASSEGHDCAVFVLCGPDAEALQARSKRK